MLAAVMTCGRRPPRRRTTSINSLQSPAHDQVFALARGFDRATAQPFGQQNVAPVCTYTYNQLVAAERQLERVLWQPRQLDRDCRRALPCLGDRHDRRRRAEVELCAEHTERC